MPRGIRASRPLATACDHTDRPAIAKGKCVQCYHADNWRKNHPLARRRGANSRTPIERFTEKVIVLPNGCWKWSGTHKPPKQGTYPMFRPPRVVKGVQATPVHAVAWAYEHIRGLKAPKRKDGVELSHTCETGSRCCNPFHVVEESHRDNCQRSLPRLQRSAAIARKHVKNPHYFEKKTHCHNGHARTPNNLTTDGKCKTCVRHKRHTRSWLKAVTKAAQAA